MNHSRSSSMHRKALMVATWLVLILLAGCGSTEPTATPAVAPPSFTATPMLSNAVPPMPSHTAPPTSAPTLSPAPTASPTPAPTATEPTPAAESEIPAPLVLTGHSGAVGSLDFSPDGALLASTGQDNTVRLWDIATGEAVQVLQGGSHSVKSVDFGPEGKLLATLDPDQRITLWDLSTGQVAGQIDSAGLKTCGFEYSPDGSLLASGHANALVRLWDVASGEMVRMLRGMEGVTCPVTFSPDGALIASGGGNTDSRVLVWEVDSGELRHTLVGHAPNVYRVVFSPDGTLLASASGDRTAKIWDMASGQLVHSLDADQYKLMYVAFSPDGQLLASGGDDGKVRLWDVENGELVHTLHGHSREIYALAFSPVERLLASAGEGGDVLLWRIPPPAALAPAAKEPSDPDPDSDGGLIAFVSTRDGNGEIYVMAAPGGTDANGGEPRRLTNWRQWDGYPTWSPDGKQIAYYSYVKHKDWVIKVMAAPSGPDADGGNPQQLTDNGICDGAPHWSPDGTRIAYNSDADCTARHREVYVMAAPGGADAAGSGQTNLTQNDADDMGGSWSPDSQQIVFASDRDGDYELYVMNATGGDVRQLTENDAQDMMATWSPDGSQITFVSDRDGNDEIYVMAAPGGSEADGSHAQRLTDNAAADWFPSWSPDGSQIIFSSKRDGNLEIYVMAAPGGPDGDGGNVQRLTNSPGDDFNAVWQPMPAGARSIPELGPPPIETRTRLADGMAMVYVPGGTFLMGSTEAQIDVARALCTEYPDDYGKCLQSPFEDESPQHPVTLDGFWLDGTEVTNAQYARCVADGACRASRLANDPAYNRDEHPVAGIPWQDAVDYCAWAGGRLPTEAEWEYAARGTEGALFSWGDEFDCEGGNFWDDGTGCDDGYPQPAPVGSFPGGASWCGAMDMAGNVWEWVADAYGPYSAEAQVNPTGPASGSERILRGGSWGYLPAFVRAAYRYPVPPTADYLAVGFRCAALGGD